ncbi:expressed unknown protein [Seminavis robusta]|uniref:Uncharacterized protein n=1 Tax=Seminavis robusta TaxID=568900 RepID=A0A9N8ERI8_9STRA|nr:expressed unknown protein [Seminavis robusta]|eukprot:Sro1409_g270170.1 n/a (172) ;mRNA; r:10464-11235
MPGRTTRSKKSPSAAGKGKRAAKAAATDDATPVKVKANDPEAVKKLTDKLYMVQEKLRKKKNRVHKISAEQMDIEIVKEEHGWLEEVECYEEEKKQLSQDDAKIARLERKHKRAAKTHDERLEKLKADLDTREQVTHEEAKKLNEEIENLRLFEKEVAAELKAAKKAHAAK